MKQLLIIALLVLAVFNLGAYSILDMKGGNQVFGGDARLLAMGSAGVYNPGNIGSLALNPGIAGLLPKGLTCQFNSNSTINSEDRSIPMYNFFDGYIDDANYVSNSKGYQDILGSINYRHQLDDLGIGVSLGWRPVVDFNSNYNEQVRNDGNTDSGNSGDNSPDGYPPIIARNYLDSEGNLGGFNATLGFNWTEQIAAGFQIQQLSGDWNAGSSIEWTDAAKELADDLEDSSMEIESEFEDSYRLGLGICYHINERLGIGFSMQMKNEISRDIHGSMDGIAFEDVFWDTVTVAGVLDSLTWQDKMENEYGQLILPGTYRLGFQYHPRNIWQTYLNFDLEYVQYSQSDERFSDVTNFYLGIEHRINQKLPLRFGFNYKTSYYIFDDGDNEFTGKVSMPSFSAGTGFKIMSLIDLDLGIEYALRKYEQLDLFPDSYYDHDGLWNEMIPTDRDWNNPDQVDESLITLQASITWHWQVK